MTEEYKKQLIDYTTGLLNKENPNPQDFNILDINFQQYKDSFSDFFTELNQNARALRITGILEDEDYDISILYGAFLYGTSSTTGLRGRGIKRENWYVINQNKIPAVLVEGGFMDSNIDYKVITSDNIDKLLDLKKEDYDQARIHWNELQAGMNRHYEYYQKVLGSDQEMAMFTDRQLGRMRSYTPELIRDKQDEILNIIKKFLGQEVYDKFTDMI